MEDHLLYAWGREMTQNLDKPFDSSYWVIPKKFLVGGYPGPTDPLQASRKGCYHAFPVVQRLRRKRIHLFCSGLET